MSCGCEVQKVVILPGQSSIPYGPGTFASFRAALLHSLPDETALSVWSPTAEGDLALQMVEWWAYLADILSLYTGRIANQDYIGTADTAASVSALLRVLGYRPRPGIGATGTVAFDAKAAVEVPLGLRLQSKPGPGTPPQTFETGQRVKAIPNDGVTALIHGRGLVLLKDGVSVVVKGKPAPPVKVGDELLFMMRHPRPMTNPFVMSVTAAEVPKSGLAAGNTKITLDAGRRLAGYRAADLVVGKMRTSSKPWAALKTPLAAGPGILHMSSLTRQIRPGDPVLIEGGPPSRPPIRLLAVVIYTQEVVWYANGDPTQPWKNPTTGDGKVVGMPVPHTVLRFSPRINPSSPYLDSLQVKHGFKPLGELLPSPVESFHTSRPDRLIAIPPASFAIPPRHKVLLEDVNKTGTAAEAVLDKQGRLVVSNFDDPSLVLFAPIRVFYQTVSISRGSTVVSEVIGSGNALVAGQDFVLQKSPVTYLQDKRSGSGPLYQSTVRLWVDGIEWSEVPSFYGATADARIFITKEDASGKTHVQFGDGVNGSRLPTGAGNVVATYRYGSGAAAPGAGAISSLPKPLPNLGAVHAPAPVGGGADPDPPAQLARYAPRSVLTFGRAVSADDYESIAAQAPGVNRARSYWIWDAAAQRALVTIFVGDDSAAVASAQQAIDDAADPNRPVRVQLATPVSIRLRLQVEVDSAWQTGPVLAAVRAALADPDTGLFGSSRIEIGQRFYESRIQAACMAVPGVVAIHGLLISAAASAGTNPYDPGVGRYFKLAGQPYVF